MGNWYDEALKNAKKIAELEAEKKKLDDEISSLKQEYNKTKCVQI